MGAGPPGRTRRAEAAAALREGARGRGAAGGPDMFRTLQLSGRGSDGYPLDVHGAKLPLPPQDPIWTQGSDATASPIGPRCSRTRSCSAACP